MKVPRHLFRWLSHPRHMSANVVYLTELDTEIRNHLRRHGPHSLIQLATRLLLVTDEDLRRIEASLRKMHRHGLVKIKDYQVVSGDKLPIWQFS